jgi:hypothetical protein
MLKVGDVISWVSGQSGATLGIVFDIRPDEFDFLDVEWDTKITLPLIDTSKYVRVSKIETMVDYKRRRIEEAAEKLGITPNVEYV